MRKIIIALLLASNFATAQDGVSIVANETCQCITGLKSNGEAITEMQLGLCMVKSYTAHKSKFPPEMQVSLTDSKGFENVAATIGIKMMEVCPDLVMEFADAGGYADEFAENHDISISGSVTEIRTEQFVTLEMKDEKGKKYSMLMLFYFDNASVLTDGKIKTGDKITASYTETELYDPKMNEFRTYKVLTDLSK